MNILFVTHSFPRDHGDAAGSFILLLARALRGEGITVRVVAPAAPGLPARSVLSGIRIDRFRYAPRKYETLAYTGNMAAQVQTSWSARLALLGFIGSEYFATRRAQKSFDPAVVHAHWWFPNGLPAARVANASGIPLVTTMHGTDVRMVRRIPASRGAFRYVLRHSNVVSVVSRWLAQETEALAGIAPVVAPMPVATDFFSPADRERVARLLFVGRLTKQKGVDLLLHAMSQLPKHIALDVVGDGPEHDALRSQASALALSTRVSWHGTVKQPDLAPYYQRAVALVVPSLDEGLGLVAVEAQLCQTPVIAFESGGLPDVIEDGVTGVLVRDRSADALATAIGSILSRNDHGANLGIAGRAHALATFAPESVARNYASIYRSALGSRTP